MSLVKSSFFFASGTFLSRIVGLLRESLVAAMFGANVYLDAFLVANRIPNLLRELVAEGALGASFTKVYSQRACENRDAATGLLRQSLWFFGLCVGALTLLGIWFAPELVDLLTLFAGHTPEKQLLRDQSIILTRVLFPFIWFMALTAILAGALYQEERFFLPSISPMVLNLGYIVGATLLAAGCSALPAAWFPFPTVHRGNFGLSIGVLLGGLGQFWLHLAIVRKRWRTLQLPRPKFELTPDLKKIFLLMGPMLLAASSGQINVLINTNFATQLEEGAVSWLTFSFRVLQLPIGIFAVAVGSVCLPRMSRAYTGGTAETRRARLSEELQTSTELLTWLILPCFCFTACNSRLIVELLFHYGKFSSYAVDQTALALYAYNFSLLGYSLVKVLTPFYYVIEKTTFPMWVGVGSIALNFGSNYFLAQRYGHVGIAATMAIVLSLNAMVLAFGTWWQGARFSSKAWGGMGSLALATSICLGAQYALHHYGDVQISTWIPNEKIRISLLLAVQGLAIGTVFLSAAYIRFSPVRIFIRKHLDRFYFV